MLVGTTSRKARRAARLMRRYAPFFAELSKSSLWLPCWSHGNRAEAVKDYVPACDRQAPLTVLKSSVSEVELSRHLQDQITLQSRPGSPMLSLATRCRA